MIRVIIISLVWIVGALGVLRLAEELRANVVLERPSCVLHRDDIRLTLVGTQLRPMTRKSCEGIKGEFVPGQL